eukprot:103234-Chlamydomonas_euryale.AAC.1
MATAWRGQKGTMHGCCTEERKGYIAWVLHGKERRRVHTERMESAWGVHGECTGSAWRVHG